MYALLFTVTVQLLEISLPSADVTVIMAVPFVRAVTRPFWSTLAMLSSDEVQTTSLLYALLGYTLAVS